MESSNIGDAHCTFTSDNLQLEQTANFDEWLDKNGVRYIINEEDPLDALLARREESSGEDSSEIDVETIDPLLPLRLKLPDSVLTSKSKSWEQLLTTRKCFVSFEDDGSKINLSFTDSSNETIHPNAYITYNIQNEQMGSRPRVLHKYVLIRYLKKFPVVELRAVIPCLRLANQRKIYICPQPHCAQACTQLAEAKLHLHAELNYRPYKCTHPKCEWSFHTASRLNRHTDTHSKEKAYACRKPGCEKRFTNLSNLNVHMRKHTRPANVPCPVVSCMMRFQTSRGIERHLKTHDLSEAAYVCPQPTCGRAFFLRASFQAHERTHLHREEVLRCDHPNCGKVFKIPCRLREHQRQHTGRRPYACTFGDCTWTFRTSSKLRRHEFTHTRERKFHCKVNDCKKAFSRKEHLKEHISTHKKFVCDFCNESCENEVIFKEHMKRTHLQDELTTEQKESSTNLLVVQGTKVVTVDGEVLLEHTFQSLGVPSDIVLDMGLVIEEPLELLENGNFSTVNLRDLDSN